MSLRALEAMVKGEREFGEGLKESNSYHTVGVEVGCQASSACSTDDKFDNIAAQLLSGIFHCL